MNARNQWTGSFTELDQYANGEEIRYTVQEAAVDGYEADVAGLKRRLCAHQHPHAGNDKSGRPQNLERQRQCF
ncbi:MAG: Cna B-type domain-containing protein [Christensenellales bacterium]